MGWTSLAFLPSLCRWAILLPRSRGLRSHYNYCDSYTVFMLFVASDDQLKRLAAIDTHAVSLLSQRTRIEASVMHPRLASETTLTYLYKAP